MPFSQRLELLPPDFSRLSYARPEPAHFLARDAESQSPRVFRRTRRILHAFFNEGRLSRTSRFRRNSDVELSRPDRTAIQPDRDRAMGTGKLQPLSQYSKPRRKQKFLAASDWLCYQSRAELPRPLGVEPSLRLGISHHSEIALVFRTRARAGNLACWYAPMRKPARPNIWTLPSAPSKVSSRRRKRRRQLYRRKWRSLVRGIHRVSAHSYSEWIHLGDWGVRDYALATGDASAHDLFTRAVSTLRTNLHRYDLGFWSLYEESGTRLPMLASSFYHRLHIVQLRVMHRLTGDKVFADYADRWEGYAQSRSRRTRALCYKGAFKLCYY